MSGFSDEEMDKILNAAFRHESYVGPEEGFLALTTAAVHGADKGTTITEPTYTGYARRPTKASEFSAAAENKLHNNALFEFLECTVGSNKLIGWAYCTTEETKSGLIVFSGVIPETNVTPGVTPRLPIGTITATMVQL